MKTWLKITLAIVLPTAVVGAYVATEQGINYYRRRKVRDARINGKEIDTKKMITYEIAVPYKYHEKYFSIAPIQSINEKEEPKAFYKAIEKYAYLPVSEKFVYDLASQPLAKIVTIKAYKNESEKIKKIIEGLEPDIKMNEA